MERKTHLFERILPFFLVIITAIIVVFLSQLMLNMKSELGEIKVSLATIESETMRNGSFEPFAALEQKCIDCHSERRFLGIHGSSAEILQIIKHMEMMPDINLSSADVNKIHSSLELLKCVRCHDEQALKKLSALSTDYQLQMIERMAEKTGSEISAEDIKNIQSSLQSIKGF